MGQRNSSPTKGKRRKKKHKKGAINKRQPPPFTSDLMVDEGAFEDDDDALPTASQDSGETGKTVRFSENGGPTD